MSEDLQTPKNKRTIIVEDIDNGAVRITVVGPSGEASTRDIADVRLSDFAPDGEDRAAYSAKHCTDAGSLHGPQGCDGMCHQPDCPEPAAFFEHSKTSDGQDQCLPFCKWHGQSLTYGVGRAVLSALDYGVPADLRFYIEVDPLPGGFPRCDHRYRAIDDWGLTWGRCTSPASKRVKVIESNGSDPSSYEAKLCTSCAAAAATGPENIEIVGELEAPPRVLGQVDFPGRYPEDNLRRRIRDFSI